MARGGIWKGSLSFGLLNIPVSLQTAQQDKGIHFHMLDEKDFSPIKYRKVNAKTGREVPYDRIVKGFEYESGQYVVLNEADFKAANPKATQTLDIEDFVPLADIDTMLFDKPYYLVPQKTGEKGYLLLRDALLKTKKVAVGKIVIRTKQHLAAVFPRDEYLVLELLRFGHEIKSIDKVDYLDGVEQEDRYSARELKMAEELIAGMTEKWQPQKYKDTYYSDLMKRIQQKIKSGKSHTVEDFDETGEESPSENQVVDLLPLLRKSLAAKKPKASHSSRKTKVKHETAG